MPAPDYQQADFTSAIQALLPRGLVWPKGLSSVMTQVAAAAAMTWVRHAQSNASLLIDAFPATATSMLPEWESALGLPDPCAGGSPTLQGRRAQVVARLANSGGQSVPFFVAYAKALGYTVTVTEFAPFRVGQRRAGAALGIEDWAYTWQINAPPQTVIYFRAGASTVGQVLASWGNRVLECELRGIKPAHTILKFSY